MLATSLGNEVCWGWQGKVLKTAADRAEQKAALNLLTVPEITNFLRGRRIPIGMKRS